jgi:polyvinyl alcohol dehydrogenase (cytochrome)
MKQTSSIVFRQTLLAAGAVLLLSTSAWSVADPVKKQWLSSGQDIQNTRNNDKEARIGVGNVDRLGIKWTYAADGDISATATVDDDSVFITDLGGSIHRLNRDTGALVWKKSVNDLIPSPMFSPPNKSRTSLAIAGDTVVFGTQTGAWVAAVSKKDGHLLWSTLLSPHPFAIVTSSPVIYGGRIYVGVASSEEGAAPFLYGIPGYTCCSSGGSAAALDLKTGAIIWQTYTVSPSRIAEGFSGGGVWGSTIAIDTKRNSAYVTTGNNYSVPDSVKQCVANAIDSAATSACTPPDVLFDSVLALNLDTGAIKWSTRLWDYDAWNVACIPFLPGAPPGYAALCPLPTGPDFDFGQGASLFAANSNGKAHELVGAGQKSGVYWALDPDTGKVVWSHSVGPGSSLGGLEWGSAVDGTRVYVALVNLYGIPFPMQPSNTLSNVGGWAAMDAATGAPVWQIADPQGSWGLGPVSVANGVAYACSMGPTTGYLYAFNAATGSTLWSYKTGASCNNGPAIVDGVAYWGTGYGNLGLGTPNNKLYAFEVK